MSKKKDVIKKALKEANLIADKRLKQPGYVESTKLRPIASYSKEYPTKREMKEETARGNIQKQVVKTRVDQLKSARRKKTAEEIYNTINNAKRFIMRKKI